MHIDSIISDLSVRCSKKDIRVLTIQEQKALERCLLNSDAPIAAGIYLTLYTGLRIGELCALKRKDIDFASGIIHVTGTMQRLRIEDSSSKTRIMITEPKSKCSIRDIPVPKPVLLLCKKYYYALSNDCFLLTANRTFIEPRLLSYHFKKYTDACNLDDVHFHTLRHTMATRCIEHNVDVKTLSEILGHYDVNVTLNRYVHPSMDLKRKNIEKLCN